MYPLAGGGGASAQEVLIQAAATAAPSVVDAVKTTTTWGAMPDLLVKCSTETSYCGDGVYNADGTDQTESQSTMALQSSVKYSFLLYNDGPQAASFNLTGPAAPSGWSVRYYMSGQGEKTSAFTGSGYTVSDLAAGGYVAGWVTVAPEAAGGGATTLDVLITAAAVSSPSTVDAVEAVTTWITSPDMLVRNISESTLIGDNIRNTNGTNQTKSQTTPANTKATYLFAIYNDGPAPASYKLTGPAGNASWAIRYCIQGAGEQTTAFTGSGFTVSNLAVG